MKIPVHTVDKLRQVGTEMAKQFIQHKETGILVSIEIYNPPKTGAQNAKLHAMVAELANENGHSFEELKETIKAAWGPRVTRNVLGKAVRVPKSWENLTKAEASALIETVHRIAAEYGGVRLSGE